MADSSFESFLRQRQQVAAAFVSGDPAPLRDISTQSDPATILGPAGGAEQGAAHVLEVNEKGSRQFQRGGTTHLEVLHSGTSGDLAYWTGFQQALVRFEGKADPVPMRLRVTEIFRREDGAWKLVHRHADPLADVQQKKH